MNAVQVTVCVLTTLVFFPLVVLFLILPTYDRWNGKKILPDHEYAVGQQGSLYLEDFHSKSISRIQPQVEVLNLSVTLVDEYVDTYEEMRSFYRKCAQNLKRAAPRLRFVSYNGGYIYNPVKYAQCSKLPGVELYYFGQSVDVLSRELTILNQHLKFLDYLSTQFKWKVTSFNFNVIMVFDSQIVRAANYPRLVLDLFNHSVSADEKSRSEAKFTFQPADTPINVRLSFSNEELFRNENQERTKFFLAPTRLGIPPKGRRA